jgi:transcriptional regulator with XRE-family HTH domain
MQNPLDPSLLDRTHRESNYRHVSSSSSIGPWRAGQASRTRPWRREAMRMPGSTVCRKLGALLRTLRTRRELTVGQVAERLGCSPSKVGRMESGQSLATDRDIQKLCDLYEATDPEECQRLILLAKACPRIGWWATFDEFIFASAVVEELTFASAESAEPPILRDRSVVDHEITVTIEYPAEDVAWDALWDALRNLIKRERREGRETAPCSTFKTRQHSCETTFPASSGYRTRVPCTRTRRSNGVWPDKLVSRRRTLSLNARCQSSLQIA